MNKRFFTLMAAVMLAGAPLSNYAFADEDVTPSLEVSIDSETKLASGLKVILKTANGYAVASNIDKTNYVALSDGSVTIDNATVLEIRNYAGKTFQLWTEGGKQVAYKVGNSYVTTFYAEAGGSPVETVEFTSIKTTALGVAGNTVISVLDVVTTYKTYVQKDFVDYNKNNITLSFDASNLEGNVFDGLKAWTLGTATDQFAAGTYLVKATADDFTKFVGAPTDKDKAAKVSFVYVKNERYGLDAATPAEGYKVVLVNGADFFKTDGTAALSSNAMFTSITEADQLNAEGALSLKMKPVVNKAQESTTSPAEVEIVAVKASSTDTKSYVTTVVSDTKFTKIYPTLGGNTYFAASEFLKVNQVSAYNIYFTNGTASSSTTDGEYHKYLAVTDHTNNVTDADGDRATTNLIALAANSIDLHVPAAQWIVTHFNGRYELTLTNRANGQILKLKMAATSTPSVYNVTSVNGEKIYVGSKNANGVALSGAQIKLIPTTLTKTDGFLTLTDQQLNEGIELSFTGKDYQLGAPTYYASWNAESDPTTGVVWNLVPSTENRAQLGVAAYKDTNKDYLVQQEAVALNANGQIISKADTLIAPAYIFSDKFNNVTKYADADLKYTVSEANVANAAKFIFVKALNGQYVMTSDVPGDDAFTPAAYGVKNKDFQYGLSDICTPYEAAFPYVGVDAYDNYDYLSLDPVSRHATLENPLGAVSMQLNKNGVLEGILSAEPLTFWLDTADSESNHPSFYISKGIPEEDEDITKAVENAETRMFLYMPSDSASYFDEPSATTKKNAAYYLEGTNNANFKAIFRPAALVAEDTLATVKGDKEVLVVTEKADAAKGQENGLTNFQFRIGLVDEEVEDEYIVRSKANGQYLYSLNGKLGFTSLKREALVFTLGEGDATANEAIAAESGVQVIGGEGVVTVQGAAGKVITVANILGQTLANQVAASDNVTIAVPAGIVVVAVDGEATKVIVK